MEKLKEIFKPFGKANESTKLSITMVWVACIFGMWLLSSFTGSTHLFPSIGQVLRGFETLWNEGLVTDITSSLSLCAQAVTISVIISLIFCYLSPIPALSPISETLSKFRYLPLAGIAFYLAIMINDARLLQVWVLVLFMSTFFMTSILAVIKDIPEEEFDHARTLGCSRWETLWEVIIKGRFDYVIESIRQNLAIVWMMIISVESILAAAGGLGFLIKNSDKLGNQGRVIALQMIILVIGISLDFLLTKGRRLVFRYSKF